MENSQDRRVKRTRLLLAKALIALTLEKGYDAVTIRDITQRADIGYATFFRHYHDKDALLLDVLEVVLQELIELLLPPASEADSDQMGTLLFRYVKEHSEVCRVLLGTRGSTNMQRHIFDAATKRVLMNRRPIEDSLVPPEIAAYHLVASSIALVQWWLEHDLTYPPERMGMIYHALIIGPTDAVAFTS